MVSMLDSNFRPVSKHYFQIAASNPNEQFYYFVCLFSWLMKKANLHFETPGQFDDPNATAANIVSELKNLNIPFEYGPNKLKQAYGEAVIYVLFMMVERVIQVNGIKYLTPIHKNEDYPEEAEVDADAEVTTDAIEEEFINEEEEEEQFMDNLHPMLKIETPDPKQQAPIKSTVDPATWKLEVERVTPLLKVQIPNDNKDWRIHLEQMQYYRKTITSALGETKTNLSKIQADIEKTLEKISSREKYVNTQFDTQTEDHRTLQEQLSELKQKQTVAGNHVTELSNELAQISEDLDQVKIRMDAIGSRMTDSKPLIDIKQGMTRLKAEIKQMDLRIGVIEHTLLHAKLKNKTAIAVAAERTFFGPGLAH
ncbi:Intraflagellar transport protein 57 [Nowakowskiella sp. JEL0407]|nr:Intraflagellar transport protein 57 [Nowakowskiella sp. JEL0407]